MDINLIIIIISVVALIVNAVVKHNRKDENVNNEPLKSLFGTEYFEEPDAEYVGNQMYYPEQDMQTENIPETQDNVIGHNGQAPPVNNLTKEENRIDIDNTINTEYDSDMEKIMDGFNLKSAIIYSEIINRKY